MHMRQTNNPTYTVLGLNNLSAMWVAPTEDGGLDGGPEIHLVADPEFAPTPTTPTAEFVAVEATFTDYALKVPTFTPNGSHGPDHRGPHALVSWAIAEAGVVTPNTVYGWWLEVAGDVFAFETFEEGQEVVMAADGDTLHLEVILPFAYTPGPLEE